MMNWKEIKEIEIEEISDIELKDLQIREKEEDYSIDDVKKYLEVSSIVNNV
jgi:hypothetical protein